MFEIKYAIALNSVTRDQWRVALVTWLLCQFTYNATARFAVFSKYDFRKITERFM
jgi:hypothetical protein